MTSPLAAGPDLSERDWQALRLRVIFDHCKWDPQCGDHAVLARFPLLLGKQTVEELGRLAEQLTREALAAEAEILGRPKLLERLALPRPIRRCLERSRGDAPRAVRVMRFDFHWTSEGWQISEVNSDVPGGYIEASGWNKLVASQVPDTAAPVSPSEAYASALAAALPAGGLVALVHATVYSEDRQVMTYLGRALSARGLEVCLAGPADLAWDRGFPLLFRSERPAALVRLTPAEWLPSQCREWEPWFAGSRVLLSNPGRALVVQSKRFPLLWDELAADLAAWRRLLPKCWCPSELENLAAEELVVKPALGRIGEDVAIRGVTGEAAYREILARARRDERRWVAQRRFEVAAVETESGPVFPTIGVFTVDGRMAGLYGRAAGVRLIDGDAQDVAVLVSARSAR